MRCLREAVVVVAALTAFLVAGMAEAGVASRLLPTDEVAGWGRRETPRVFTPGDLYEYINGNADLFNSFGFEEAAVGDYVPTGAKEGWISVDVYDMGAPLHAFGIYGAEKADGVEAAAVGVQGYESAGVIAFWKGRYYVKVSTIEGDDAAGARRLAELVADRIGGEPAMPVELSWLPLERQVAGSERYVRKSALGHRFLNEVVSAQYELGPARAFLYIADLGEPKGAAEAFAKLREFEVGTEAEVVGVEGVGEAGFAVRDPYYGEMVVGHLSQYVALAIGDEAGRSKLADLVRTALSRLPREDEKGCWAGASV